MQCETQESNGVTQYYCDLTNYLDFECMDDRQKHFLTDNRDVRKNVFTICNSDEIIGCLLLYADTLNVAFIYITPDKLKSGDYQDNLDELIREFVEQRLEIENGN